MALIRTDFVSESLKRTVTFNAIIPTDKFARPGTPKPELKPFKTLYLLHGIFGNYTDWVSGTRIQRWAQEKDLAVIMPSGENGFYVDHAGRGDLLYGEYIGQELVKFTRDLFQLSDRREDTFIAGLSMGGYGAIRNGLVYSDTFSCIGALSSALIIDQARQSTNDSPMFMGQRSYFESVFGDLTKLDGSDKDYKALVLKHVRSGKPLPKIYMCCGKDDFLLSANQDYRDFLREQNADLTYEEGPGSHEWDFWDTYIRKFIDWLPLDKNATAGVNS
jgi:putative tributyrin esterase